MLLTNLTWKLFLPGLVPLVQSTISPQLYFSSLFLIPGLFLSILVLSTPLLRLIIYVEALQFVLHPLEPPIRSPIPLHCSLSSPQLPTRIGYTSPPHQGGGYTLCSTPPGPSIRSTQAPQLPLVRLPSPVLALPIPPRTA
ncbi:hypothetical protein F5876DRAFT_84913 [Lentinula aff. lateritia]|uniref:Uncharacterized protein n=1 Tax=Lentinula aff. lateritia TaxID=2804960 RepID=A0ACC1TG55_9AGAR|nr:hypothetical protein F5876DRAFT_84913 [Lentinula aff. lateritia]